MTVGLSLTPATVTLTPGGTQTFTANETCTNWKLVSPSGSPTAPANGTTTVAYTAGTTLGTVDTLTCTDASGNTAVAKVTVGLNLSPSAPTVAPGASTTITLSQNGGTDTGTWSRCAGAGPPSLRSD